MLTIYFPQTSIAATFSSPRYQADPSGFYQLLRTIKTMETALISSTLTVSQNNQNFCIEDVTGKVHIEHTPSGLVVFVPRGKKDQGICFSSVLPRKFAEWLMQDSITQRMGKVESEMVNILTAFFAYDRSVLSEICDSYGVFQVQTINEDAEDDDGDTEDDEEEDEDYEEDTEDDEDTEDEEEDEGEDDEEDDHDEEEDGNSESEQQQGQRTPSPDTPGSNSETLVESVFRQSHLSSQPPPDSPRREDTSSHRQRPIAHSRLSNTPDLSLTQTENRENLASAGPSADTQYGVLLERVVTAAQSITFPSQGSFDMSDLRNNLPGQLRDNTFESFDGLDIVTRFRSANQLERDKKVGAAGELFVSTYLLQIVQRGL